MRIGQGIDVHAFAQGAGPLVLGGVVVDDTLGLAGHSDADVLAHAVADALLGALALGDLGSRFGVDDPAVAGADSMGLLATVVADVAAAGWAVGNVDATLLAQAPRLAPHRPAMRTNLARVLDVDEAAVSVKATTTDHLGFLGRTEGVACSAVVLLVPLG
jgi:2-C-methyl-D-erythritol 2,4-cyclodiphosphate synthase